MSIQLLEARVAQLVTAVLSGGRCEDSRFELKSTWPQDHRKAARQIAGLANAHSGGQVTWVVGIDEDNHALTDPGDQEVESWWAQVRRWFAELAPTLENLVVPVAPERVVTVLRFDASRAPYLVTTAGGVVDREVPWREGNSTRSAHRHELVQVLARSAIYPSIEFIESTVCATEHLATPCSEPPQLDGTSLEQWISLQGRARAYVETAAFDTASVPSSGTCVFPEHLWEAHLRLGTLTVRPRVRIHGPRAIVRWSQSGPPIYEPRGSIESVPASGLHVRGSDAIEIEFDAIISASNGARLNEIDDIVLLLKLPLTRSSYVANLEIGMQAVVPAAPPPPGVLSQWEFTSSPSGG